MSEEATPIRALFVCDEDCATESDDDAVDGVALTRYGPRIVPNVSVPSVSGETGLSDSVMCESPPTKRRRRESEQHSLPAAAIATPGTAVGFGRVKKMSNSTDSPAEVEPTQIAMTPGFSGETPYQYTQLEPATETQEAVVAEGVTIPSPPPAFPALLDEDSPRALRGLKGNPEQLDEWSKLVKTFFQQIDQRPLIVDASETSN